ncbi:succinate dehydrogenase, cytochrome b556 subunit [Marinicella litoralis]|uniref:Succinate dehydrogenase cytochrome b556 subunit n=1 Tax=Marinicella litoralis TaxID=644220 RepID=A0A4R6XRV1_9GAMM|nr:succinate dehydrogenase, cytochrome b556 subunit [Marinicella litoralis]TDR22476.1 succinate dehydrogenase subunit C [Marinicella litoralis]
MSSTNRPLSPHLQVYKPQLTSMMSIAHRLTGMVLAFGLVVFTYWLYRVTTQPIIADQVSAFFSSGLGVVMLYAWVFTFNYHLCNGIRHLFWDAGKGYSIPAVYKSGVVVIIMAVIFTAAVFFLGK